MKSQNKSRTKMKGTMVKKKVHSPTYMKISFASVTVDSLKNRDIEKTAKEEDDMTKPKMTTPPWITEPAGRHIVNTMLNKKSFQSIRNRCLKKK